jgi:hypothetical protein
VKRRVALISVLLAAAAGVATFAVVTQSGDEKRDSDVGWTVAAPVGDRGARVEHAGWSVVVRPGATGVLTMHSDRRERRPTAALRALTGGTADARPDRPVGVHVRNGKLGRGGAIVTRRLATPLPRDRTIRFTYFDPSRDAWRPVQTRLSRDRRTLTAKFNHFSWVDTITYHVSEVLDERVDPPECSRQLPEWMQPDGITFLDDKTAPLRWCAGRDPRNRDRLQVKVRVNRSYGVAAQPAVKPLATEASVFGGGPVEFLNGLVARAPRIPGALLRGYGGGVPVMGGQEATFLFSEAQVRKLQGAPLVRVSLGVWEAAAGQVFAVFRDFSDGAMSYVASLAAIAQCEQAVLRPASRGDWRDALDGLGDCLTSEAYTVSQISARVLTEWFPDKDPRELGALAGRAARILKRFWIGGAVFKTGTWLADRKLHAAAFEIRAYATIIRRRPRPRRPVSCGEIGFEENTDNLASKIEAVGTSCDVARALVEAAAVSDTRFTPDGEPFELNGFSCTVSVSEEGLPVYRYRCTAGDATVTWEKT